MNDLVSGIVLEGLSTAGKTSVLKEIKRVQSQDADAERSVVILGEHYSQQLQRIKGKEVSLSESTHAELLKERIDGISVLNSWALELGPYNRASRGLFYLFERFHLNHRISFPDSSYIKDIERKLTELACNCVLLTVSIDKIEQRLDHRSRGALDSNSLRIAAADWLMLQEKLLECADKSIVPTKIINTDGMAWSQYAKEILKVAR